MTVKRKKKKPTISLQEALHMIAPGTQMREAISYIIQSHNGALICCANAKRFADLSEGGVKLDSPNTPQLLYELSKMDGAIVLSNDGTRILYANRFLKADPSITSDETGTRHRAAERLAKQTGAMVICVSERRSSVTLYVGEQKHVMDSIATLLNKATQAIQTLEKYINVLVQSIDDLSAREFQDMVTIFDVCKAVQAYEMVKRIASEIDPFLLELGTEGRLTRLQVAQLVQPLGDAQLVVHDYYREKQGLSPESVLARIGEIPEQELLDVANISQALGYGTNLRNVDTYLTPRGYRVLTTTRRLTQQQISDLVKRFSNLQAIMRAPMDELCEVEGIGEVLAERLRVTLNLLRSQVTLDMGAR